MKKAKSAGKKVGVKTGERGGTREGFRIGSVRVAWYSATGYSAWGEAPNERRAREIAETHWRAHFEHSVPQPSFEKVTKLQPVLGFVP
jgi:hypothetical protein